MNNIMLDLETMGSQPDSAIVAIGAVAFDPQTGQIGERFHCVVDLASSVEYGGSIQPETVIWWMKQSDAARRVLTQAAGEHIYDALTQFGEWLAEQGDYNQLQIWGNGTDFDNVILTTAYQRAELELPWSHWNNRCYRTLKSLHPDIKLERVGTHHSAVDDAESQARHLMKILNH